MSGETQTPKPKGEPTEAKEFKYLLDDLYFRLQERDAWYDQAIKYLLYGNGSAVALTIGLMGALAARGVPTGMLWLAIPAFFAGIVAVGVAVYQSAKCAADGRRAFRIMLEEYVHGKLSYTEIFLKLPNLPSKWEKFSQACFVSAFSFLTGVALVTYVAASGQFATAESDSGSVADAVVVAAR